MGWNDYKKVKEEGGGDLFLTFKDGEAKNGVFRGEPYVFYSIFGDKKEYQQPAEGRSTRFKINFAMKVREKWTMKILSGGFYLMDDIWKAIQKYGTDRAFEVKRAGTGQKTRYSVMPDLDSLSVEALGDIGELKMHELNRGRKVSDSPVDNSPAEYDERNPPPAEDEMPPAEADEEDMF